MPKQYLQKLSQFVFTPKTLSRQRESSIQSCNTYAVIDAARIADTWINLQTMPVEYNSLYEGQEAQDLEDVAPYLVKLCKDSDFTHWVFDAVYGDYGCIFIHSDDDLSTLTEHLRGYAKIDYPIENTQGEVETQKVFYAFYDPRVFPRFMKGASAEQLEEFFGHITRVQCEKPDHPETLLAFYLTNKPEEWACISLPLKDSGE